MAANAEMSTEMKRKSELEKVLQHLNSKPQKLDGVIQDVFEIGNCFWVRENSRPNFDKLTKIKVFTKPLISKHRANHKLSPMYIKHDTPV